MSPNRIHYITLQFLTSIFFIYPAKAPSHHLQIPVSQASLSTAQPVQTSKISRRQLTILYPKFVLWIIDEKGNRLGLEM